jgi:threonine/homoserine/homoserine lactone efflux protein
MVDLHTAYIFISINILLAFTPGPDNIYVLTQGITKGKKEVLVTVFGFCTGVVVHTLLATFGVSAIFQTSQLAFDIIKYIGAIYLIYLAYQAFKHRDTKLNLDSKSDSKSLKRLYVQAMFMNILNPKVALFFLAFLPQFVKPENSAIEYQMLTLGFLFLLVTVVVFSFIGISGNMLSKKLRENERLSVYLNTLTSFVLFGIGVKLIFTQR